MVMEFGSPLFVLGIIAIAYGGWIINTMIRARHGYPLENEWGGTSTRDDIGDKRRIELLSDENAAQQGQIARLEERIAVLERIVTDRSRRLADEIDALKLPNDAKGGR
jgi:hypothetical protein